MTRKGERKYVCYKCNECFRSKTVTDRVRCSHCEAVLMTRKARLAYMGQHEGIQNLSSGPVAGLTKGKFHSFRPFVETLSIRTGSGCSHGTWTQVLYMVGDEREAIRLFIEVNEENIRSVMNGEGPTNAFKQQWPDFMWEMLEEQWYLGGYF